MTLHLEIKEALGQVATVPSHRATAFFKMGKGQYAETDQFIGVSVPNIRKIATTYSHLARKDLQALMRSKINEERLLALIILVQQYQTGRLQQQEALYQFYVDHLIYVNNWNLVDASAHFIVGAHLYNSDRRFLLKLAKSNSLWDRRIAMVSTWYFIKQNDLEWTFKLATLLLADKQDLIHKAVGWMLREAGKRNVIALKQFLALHSAAMPRTMLRYAIEKFSPEQRKQYLLKGKSK